MSDESAATLSRAVESPRPRARTERWGYWLPLLLLGLLILAAPLAYRRAAFSAAVALYWLGTLITGIVATVLGYHRRGRRRGAATPTRTFLLVGLPGSLFLLGILLVTMDQSSHPIRTTYDARTLLISMVVLVVGAAGAVLALRRRPMDAHSAWRVVAGVACVAVAALSAYVVVVFAVSRGDGPLVVIAMALLGLAAVARNRFCAVVAILFTAATLVDNLSGIGGAAYLRQVPDPFTAVRLTAFAHVLPPATVLIAAGIIGAIGARKTSR